MKYVLLSMMLLMTTTLMSMADVPPPPPDDWVPKTPKFECSIDTEVGVKGWCRIFVDGDAALWVVFWDKRDTILFIRTKVDGKYVYFYYRKDGIPV